MLVEYFNTKGILVENDNPDIEYKIVAKKVTTANLVRFYVKRRHGRFVDVLKLNDREIKNSICTYFEVDEPVFKKYIAYMRGTTTTPLSSIERM